MKLYYIQTVQLKKEAMEGNSQALNTVNADIQYTILVKHFHVDASSNDDGIWKTANINQLPTHRAYELTINCKLWITYCSPCKWFADVEDGEALS